MFKIEATDSETGARTVWTRTPTLAAAVRLVLALREDGDGSDTFAIYHPNGAIVTRRDVRRAGLDLWTGAQVAA